MHFTRTSAGMSPGLSLPTSWWMKSPSSVSRAIFARYSWERCIGLRSWSAATVFHPFSANSFRVSAGRM